MEYQELNLHQHVLHRPDTYVGSKQPTEYNDFVWENGTILKQTTQQIPAILRIFVEALSNAIDNKWRSDEFNIPCKAIRVHISPEGKTSVWNDGKHIPIQKNENGIWIPDMLFGRLLTSSNFKDTEDRFTSGRNGLGITLTNIFSTQFNITVIDPETQQIYTQEWRDNMKVRCEPKIKKSKNKGCTLVEWIPDFQYFGMEKYSEDMLALMYRYVYDTAMLTGLTVYLNDVKINLNLKDYSKLYATTTTKELIYIETEKSNAVISASQGEHECISFVNGVYTKNGGVHVDAWCDAIFKPLIQKLAPKFKITQRDLKPFFRIFVVAKVANPEFSSQMKHKMTAPTSTVKLDTKYINTISKWKFVETLQQMRMDKELGEMKKQSGKSRKKIDGYDPANKAGGKDSSKCTLILCEGLSAKTYAVMGIQEGVNYGDLTYKGRDYFGVMALRGKILNTRNASISMITANKEISNIIQAMGLKYDIDYTIEKNFQQLNYGRILLLVDSDHDGFHIKGLVINMLEHLFPSLLKREQFLHVMATPIMKVELKNKTHRFYNLQQARNFLKKNSNEKLTIKYYKGLGTSTDRDVKETFGKRVISYDFDEKASDNLNKVFAKDNSNLRKQWLEDYIYEDDLPYQKLNEHLFSLDISDFVNKELITFSQEDCRRSLPNLMDGLKESQRKILYAAIIKNLNKPLKVAQLAGFVAEKTQYHHGEQCLYDTITKMAQDFIGSNNLPILQKEGQFGSRVNGGKDAASARYIYTYLSKITEYVFPQEDNPILTHLEEDGETIEPQYFLPIIPLILVNGITGSIGTGWSCSIPSYNPRDLIEWILSWLDKEPTPELTPWYRNFTGEIRRIDKHRYETRGILRQQNKKFHLEELPIGIWTDKFKDHLEDLIEKKKIKSLLNFSTPDKVSFEITPHPEAKDWCTVENLGLTSIVSTSNMVLFDENGRIKKYDTVDALMAHYCEVRLDAYTKRKAHLLRKFKLDLSILVNKIKFMMAVVERRISLYDLSAELLEKERYDPKDGSYDYLLDLSIKSFTRDKIQKLEKHKQDLELAIRNLTNKTPAQIWKDDLNILVQKLPL
jgi:DNA topoisomerase II